MKDKLLNYAAITAILIIKSYKAEKKLEAKLGITIKWVILTLIFTWALAGILQNTPHY